MVHLKGNNYRKYFSMHWGLSIRLKLWHFGVQKMISPWLGLGHTQSMLSIQLHMVGLPWVGVEWYLKILKKLFLCLKTKKIFRPVDLQESVFCRFSQEAHRMHSSLVEAVCINKKLLGGFDKALFYFFLLKITLSFQSV